jgi:hypothetical protein
MHKTAERDSFFEHLMQTHWFKETVDLYFNKDYRLQYDAIMRDFRKRGIVIEQNGRIFTAVKP